MGPGTSPILFENLIILQCEQEMGDGSYIVALNRADGAEVWRQARSTRRSWATPLVVRTGQGVRIVTCLDALIGSVVYEGGRPLVPATVTASLVAYKARIPATSEDGDTFVLKAGRSHEILPTNSVGEPVYASLAPAGDTIYIRGAENLYAIREGK